MQTIECTTQHGLDHQSNHDGEDSAFSRQWVRITKEEHIALVHQANYWQAQHARLSEKLAKQAELIQHHEAKIKDLQSRVFGKKSEKRGSNKSQRAERPRGGRPRGQACGRPGHGRTARPNLPIVTQVRDLAEDEKYCPGCSLPYVPKPALDEHNEL